MSDRSWVPVTAVVPGSTVTNLSWLTLSFNDLRGAIPVELGRLESLAGLSLGGNDLTGRIPAELGNLANLTRLELGGNDLTGPIPAELGSLTNLERLDLSYNWGLAGPLPSGLELSSLEELDFFVTQACAPDDWREWLATIEFYGPPCGAGADLEIDVAVVYTPAAREAAGGASAIEAGIDLMIAETNEAYAASGVPQRLALAGRSEAPYTETDGHLDVRRLREPSDGHLDEAHTLRDRVGADLVHLIVSDPYYDVCGMAAGIPGVFGLTLLECGGLTFAHELGHNMGLRHDRFRVDVFEGSLSSHPAYGYVNQRVFDASAPRSARWMTIMSYVEHCRLADVACVELPRFSNPRQRYDGDPLGVPFGTGSGLTGPSDAAAVLGAMGPAVAAWRDRPADAANRPPVVVGTLSDPSLDSVGDALDVDVSQAFVDPDGDSLTYTVSSAEPWLVRAHAAGAVVTLTGAGEGTATIRVTATDPGGLSVSSAFSVTVEGPADPDPQGTVESDRAALEALYDTTGGPSWTESTSWKTSAPLGEWHGVTTDTDGRVTGLSLADNGVAGPIPFEMASLVKLETLDLCLNDLSGPIPAALGGLVNLRWLALCFNDLSGPIPVELGKLANLEWLGLYFNDLSGPIPAELGGLVNLGALNLSRNDLTGSIPARLGNLTQLRGLSLGWKTVMAYGVNCGLADARCPRLPRFSNPDLRYDGDPLGVAFGAGSGVTGASDAAAVLNVTGPAAAAWRDRPPRANRAPVAVGTLPDRRLSLDGRLDVNVSPTFDDPDGDPLTYAVSSSAASVVTVRALGPSVTLTGVGEGTATIRVTATDPGGLSAAQQFRVTVAAAPAPFTDDPIRSGVTPIRAVHFTELRSRIAALRTAAGLAPFRWTDPVLRAGVTRVRLVHLLELREALAAAYVSAGRTPPRWTDSTPMGGTTPIRAAHLTELRVAVVALERG